MGVSEEIDKLVRWQEEVAAENARISESILEEALWDILDGDSSSPSVSERFLEREQKIPKSRNCPCCKEFVFNNRSWVLSRTVSVCRSCWYKFYSNDGSGPKRRGKTVVVLPLFRPIFRYVLDGRKIKGQISNFSKFSKALGWSRQYQYKILNNKRTVDQETVKALMIGLSITSSIILSNETRYEFYGPHIKTYREKCGLSVRKFAEKCDWSGGYQQKIESGRVYTIGREPRDRILDVFKEYDYLFL